ncbi:hypothetical protein NEOLEDRAFT_1142630 [Neolentinus lepideus HHB14362 ss-1]|uniref:Uncharacterized protein n=1 Tax=Neolentinus lepideus HHB14362 ss-1 TaxID=1314782 RepID=A0A165N0X5_9AGAM|nr:hypothetical protein NEOLEDRAFT_1142630 [Neolentinus lepideus HHB14362 ss-1]
MLLWRVIVCVRVYYPVELIIFGIACQLFHPYPSIKSSRRRRRDVRPKLYVHAAVVNAPEPDRHESSPFRVRRTRP